MSSIEPSTNAAAAKPAAHIRVEPFDGTVTVKHADAVVASSKRALRLSEGSYPPVFYIPFEDIYFERLKKSDTQTTCPHKGVAAYWSISAVGEMVKDAMWAYEQPYEGVSAIAGHGAFYPDKVSIDSGPAEDKPLPI